MSYESYSQTMLTAVEFLAARITKEGFVQRMFYPFTLTTDENPHSKDESNDKAKKTESHVWLRRFKTLLTQKGGNRLLLLPVTKHRVARDNKLVQTASFKNNKLH